MDSSDISMEGRDQSAISMGVVWLIVISLAWGWAFQADIAALISEWDAGGAYSHGWLMLAVSLYLLWKKKAYLSSTTPRFYLIPLALSLMLATLWLLGGLVNVLVVKQLMAISLLHALVWLSFGWRVYRQLLFPLFILFLVVPVWDFLAGSLQDFTTDVSYRIVHALGVPVYLEGHTLNLAGGIFVVEKACSGLSFFMTALSLSLLYGYLFGLNLSRQLFLIGISLFLAIALNWLRVVIIVLVGDATDMQHMIVSDHLTFGWILFAVLFFPLFFYISGRLSGNAVEEEQRQASTNEKGGYIAPASALVILLLLPQAGSYLEGYGVNADYRISPPVVSGWQETDGFVAWEPVFEGSAHQDLMRYTNGGSDLFWFSASYPSQVQGGELINEENSLFSTDEWNLIGEDSLEVSEDGALGVILELSGAHNKRVIVYWYVIAGEITTSAMKAKLLELKGIATGNRGASVVAIGMDSDQVNLETTIKQLIEFARSVQRDSDQAS